MSISSPQPNPTQVPALVTSTSTYVQNQHSSSLKVMSNLGGGGGGHDMRLRLPKLGPECSFVWSSCCLRRLLTVATTSCQALLTRSTRRWFELSPLCTPEPSVQQQHKVNCQPFASKPRSLKQLNALVPIFLGPLSIEIGTQVPNRRPLGSKVMSAHAFLAFLGHFTLWMGMFKVFRWTELEILIPKHMWKCNIGPLEQI